ncbi:hypothetical protein HU200_006701 [Digitaria exilis]|uniref:HMA domain-containing protein n=1 Tax=Digitaria exilis TaxID=1010633 RepID=A0A835FPL4_9POAL|nr:hypothetical protein HU200_006701 [Digitaria exilis]
MAAKQKVVLLLDLQGNDVKEKRKVLKAVSTYPGLDLIAVDMKQRKLTVVGLVDPIELVTKLRKHWRAYIFYVGPATAATGAEATANQVDVPHAVVVPATYPYQPHQEYRAARENHDNHPDTRTPPTAAPSADEMMSFITMAPIEILKMSVSDRPSDIAVLLPRTSSF